MNKLMKEKVALVTGAGSGIGRAAALAFAAQGANVAVTDINEAGAAATAHEIEAAGGEALALGVDVTKDAQVREMIASTVEHFGRLDFAHNNAGIFSAYAPIDEFPEESWDETMAVNAKGVWLCMKHELAHMKPRRAGVIVNTASVVSLIAQANVSAYVASKHAVLGLTKTAAIEAAPHGIRVNAVCPGFVRTPATEAYEDVISGLVTRVPLRRQAESDEVADAVVFLCSEQATFVTGHGLVLDGGLSISPID